ncbi:acetoacetate--CoA ligase [Thermopetrobacter sp. TC1]|uniref:acetoacetate--CoA ligase n=1 Tax=Thermopetrobacter sp. TC1 TaxID=1495045 RepID=UPI00056E047A|nr:acetoacetate--CoA ligase [Thermopetrobacter sp. TC1]
MSEAPLWIPSEARKAQALLTRFLDLARERSGRDMADYRAMHAWSVADPAAFWDAVWDFARIRGEKGEVAYQPAEEMRKSCFFPQARLNYAENILAPGTGREEEPALIFRNEAGLERVLSWEALKSAVAGLQKAFLNAGVKRGDRIAAITPNMPEAIIGMLAASSIGAVWSSCSPDFGPRGILDRFGQIEPVLLLACDGYHYNGKVFDITEKVRAVKAELPSVRQVIVFDHLGRAQKAACQIPDAVTWADFVAPFAGEKEPQFAALPFDHPLYILFSSGTTGVPKCIVHRAGGILLKHMSELMLSGDVREGDRLFYFTTCGWMMWNWLASGLGAGATLLLYDGSPFHPGPEALFRFAEAHGMTHFGTSAKYIDALRKSGLEPNGQFDLGSLRTMFSTGSPLAPKNFDFVYEAVKADLHLASISGGTDICGCFVGGIPTEPVWRGEIQGPMPGMAVDVFDENGQPVREGLGELVCTKPFPSMPLMFWNDPEEKKFRAAYFERFPGVWHHGDFAEWTKHGGMIIHGRSDATLNPGGVRIGTAEIYAQVEEMPEIVEALAIGQKTPDDDERIVLFVRLAEGVDLTEDLKQEIRRRIRSGASPRHVPAVIAAVPDIPRTRSGKIVEIAVRDVVHGRPVKNVEALANPEALEYFRDHPDLAFD